MESAGEEVAGSGTTGCAAASAVVILAFIVVPLAFVLGDDVVDYLAPQRFTPERWIEAQRSVDSGLYRWRMRHALVREYDLIGMRREEVEALLGPRHFDERRQQLGYSLGPTRHGINVGVLEIDLEDGRVVRYSFRES